MDGKILVVDDEEGIRNSFGEYLEHEGFTVVLAENGTEAVETARKEKPDVVILDVQIPSLDGLEVCKKLRQELGNSVGIIMMSGHRKETLDKVVGLELGSDVYITKPIERRELNAQVRALLRRLQSRMQEAQTGWFAIDDYLRINFEQRVVEAGGKEVHLTKLEFDLLKYLFDREGKPVGRSDLVDNVWGYEAGGDISDGAVNVAVAKLRAKIESDLDNRRYIHAVHGIGYRFKRI